MNLKIKKLLAAIGASAALMALAPSAYADDYYFDMSKARQTFGNGTGSTYSDMTRLDNERRDKDKFNPLWLTEDSSIVIEYVSEGDYEEAPAILVLQSWVGELVSGTDDKWVQVLPSSYDDTTATFTYEDMVAAYGNDFSDVYALNVVDSGNALLIKSMMATNVEVPEDEVTDKLVGTIVKEGELPPGVEETSAITDDSETVESDKIIESNEGPTEEAFTEPDNEPSENEGSDTSETTQENIPVEQNDLLTILIAIGVLWGLLAVTIIVVVAIKKKGRNYHRFK